MKLIIARHGDPDYENDTLTPKGCREAELLADRLARLDIGDIYCSPLGRAAKTASYTLDRLGRSAVVCDWLREFDTVRVKNMETGAESIAWDQLPALWTQIPEFYDKDSWHSASVMAGTGIDKAAKSVADGLDGILALHGYEREGGYYRAVSPNSDTLLFFCHFGVTCVMLGHLLGISPMVLWHGTITRTTSVTLLCTEERRPGAASFRMSMLGDISHLNAACEPPSFSGRFRELYTNEHERRD